VTINENVRRILAELPEGVNLVAAAKDRHPEEVLEAVQAGIRLIGENYVQEAEEACSLAGTGVGWHFIGHLQGNKVKKAVQIFDMIETVDSVALAGEIEKRCAQIKKLMPVLIEVNSGREPQKSGALPENVEGLLRDISVFPHLKVMGLMTIGPLRGNPEGSRFYFRETRNLRDRISLLDLPGIEMKYLSMGMSDTYRIAIEEGANIVRIGTGIFGERKISRVV